MTTLKDWYGSELVVKDSRVQRAEWWAKIYYSWFYIEQNGWKRKWLTVKLHELAVINDSLQFGQAFVSQDHIKGQAYKYHEYRKSKVWI